MVIFLKETSAQQVDTTQRLSDLRSHFQSNGINGYIIPSVDAHQVNKYNNMKKNMFYIMLHKERLTKLKYEKRKCNIIDSDNSKDKKNKSLI